MSDLMRKLLTPAARDSYNFGAGGRGEIPGEDLVMDLAARIGPYPGSTLPTPFRGGPGHRNMATSYHPGGSFTLPRGHRSPSVPPGDLMPSAAPLSPFGLGRSPSDTFRQVFGDSAEAPPRVRFLPGDLDGPEWRADPDAVPFHPPTLFAHGQVLKSPQGEFPPTPMRESDFTFVREPPGQPQNQYQAQPQQQYQAQPQQQYQAQPQPQYQQQPQPRAFAEERRVPVQTEERRVPVQRELPVHVTTTQRELPVHIATTEAHRPVSPAVMRPVSPAVQVEVEPPWTTAPEESYESARRNQRAGSLLRQMPPDPTYRSPLDDDGSLSDHWAKFTRVQAKPQLELVPENQTRHSEQPRSSGQEPEPQREERPKERLIPILHSSSGSNLSDGTRTAQRRKEAPHVRFEGKKEVFYITPNPSPSPSAEKRASWRFSRSPERSEEEEEDGEPPRPRRAVAREDRGSEDEESGVDTSSLRDQGPIVWPPRRTPSQPEPSDPREMRRRNRIAAVGPDIERILAKRAAKNAAATKQQSSQPPPPQPKPKQPSIVVRRPTLEDVGPPRGEEMGLRRLERDEEESSPEPESEYYEAPSSWATSPLPPPGNYPSSSSAVGNGAAGGGGETPAKVRGYEDVIAGPLAEFLALSAKIGGKTAEVGRLTESAFGAQRDFVWTAAGLTKAAGESRMGTLLGPTSEAIAAIQALAEANRRSEEFNHLSAVSEGIPALGWVTMAPTPAPFVKEMADASMFYTNRVLKDHKDKDPVHAQWVKAWLSVLRELQAYVKREHTTGLEWNSAPGSAPAGGSKAAPPPPPGPGGPPPPPPPPPASLFEDLKKGSSSSSDADAKAALFADLNKGEAVTAGLKKVTDDMKTHKNPSLRATAVVPAGATGPPKAPPKPAHLTNGGPTAAPAAKAPITQLEGKKWVVENHKNNKNVVIECQDMKQVVYIWKCEGSVIQVKGKANSITMDSCKKTSVVFDSLVSQMEVINSQSVQVQSLGAMPTLAIQKTDGCQVYLSMDSRDAEIVTSKSSEMNILIPAGPEGDFQEFPVPEQYKTTYDGKTLNTVVVDV